MPKVIAIDKTTKKVAYFGQQADAPQSSNFLIIDASTRPEKSISCLKAKYEYDGGWQKVGDFCVAKKQAENSEKKRMLYMAAHYKVAQYENQKRLFEASYPGATSHTNIFTTETNYLAFLKYMQEILAVDETLEIPEWPEEPL